MDGEYKRLKKIRERLGLSQREIGDITGVDPHTLSRYERGKLTPFKFYCCTDSKHFTCYN